VEAFDEIYGLYGRLRWHLMHIAWEIEAIFDDLQNNNPGHAPGGGGKMERIVKECPWIICERQREVICA
jgi:hypothetical protein